LFSHKCRKSHLSSRAGSLELELQEQQQQQNEKCTVTLLSATKNPKISDIEKTGA